ncbi:prominin (prom) protein, putative [Schistosoma mansoni]|uniref:prominin (prom) protein, putative n=1 Tax=Schistosoma mansoni TaxID=6183 RepID=UPI0001A642CD|nr:prominin (prom) protein, putative [Schistosoma mansoni]|eukprot:XP_018646386.1 prominin (prom) protein, putative [Schistosoma mansoni]
MMRVVFSTVLFLCVSLDIAVCNSEVDDDSSTRTTLQLRDSVEFSYSISNFFLDLIRGKKPPTAVFETLVNIQTSHHSRLAYRSVEPVVTTYLGYGICLVFGLLFAIFMPLVGIVFFCARCCGKCGGRVQFVDSKHDPCKRVVYTICLVLIVTFQLAAVVLAFINHHLFHEALVSRDPRIGAFSQANLSLIEFEEALKDMVQMAKNTSSTDLSKQKERFMRIIDDGLVSFEEDFTKLSQANNVSDAISGFQTCCPIDKIIECRELMELANDQLKVRVPPNVFQIEEVISISNQIQRHLPDVDYLNEFNKTINNLAVNVKRSISDDLDRAWNDLAQSPKTREKLASVFEHIMVNVSTTLKFIRDRISLEINEEINDHYLRAVEYVLYGGVALLCIPILIFLILYLGLCFGTCGDRPYEEAGLCNRGVGANFLLAGVGFMFLFSTILMASCIVPFLFGGTLQTEVCRYLTGRYPDGPRKMDQYVFESLKSIFYAVEGSLSDSSKSRTFHVDKNELDAIRPTLDIIRFNLSDAILTRCENEPFVEAISTGEFVSPVLSEAIDGILQGLIESFKKIDLESPFRRTIQSCLAAFERLKFLSVVDIREAIKQVNTPLTFIDNLDEFVSRLKALNMNSLTSHIQALVDGPVKLDATRGNIYTLFMRFNSIPDQMNHAVINLNKYNQTLSTSVQSRLHIISWLLYETTNRLSGQFTETPKQIS